MNVEEQTKDELHARTDSDVRMLAIDELHESPQNPRKHYPEGPLAELAASMRIEGWRIWNPGVARPLATGGYEVAAAHRRLRAAKMANLTHVPFLVRAMEDEEFLKILLFDNSGREDVHPLHEAAGWLAWLKQPGKTVLDIAAQIGKSKEYVYQRLQYDRLIPEAKEAFLNDRISPRHASLIARQVPRDQKNALEFCLPSYDPDRRISYRVLDRWIQEHCHLSLNHVDFDLADAALLPLAGSCVECPKRSGSNPELFSDIEGPNICTDAGCYREKVKAFEAMQPTAPEPEPGPPAPKPAAPPKPDLKLRAEKKRQEEEAQQRREAERKRYEEMAMAEREKVRKEAERAEKVYKLAVNAILEKVTYPLSQEDFAALVGHRMELFDCDTTDELAQKFAIPQTTAYRWKDIQAALPKMPAQKIARIAIAACLLDTGETEGYDDTARLEPFAKRAKVSLDAIRKQVDAEANPKPAPAADARRALIAKLPEMGKKAAQKSAPAKAKAPKPAPKKKGKK